MICGSNFVQALAAASTAPVLLRLRLPAREAFAEVLELEDELQAQFLNVAAPHIIGGDGPPIMLVAVARQQRSRRRPGGRGGLLRRLRRGLRGASLLVLSHRGVQC